MTTRESDDSQPEAGNFKVPLLKEKITIKTKKIKSKLAPGSPHPKQMLTQLTAHRDQLSTFDAESNSAAEHSVSYTEGEEEGESGAEAGDEGEPPDQMRMVVRRETNFVIPGATTPIPTPSSTPTEPTFLAQQQHPTLPRRETGTMSKEDRNASTKRPDVSHT